MRDIRATLITLLLAGGLAVAGLPILAGEGPSVLSVPLAHADDDDDDDDDDGGRGGGGSSDSGRLPARSGGGLLDLLFGEEPPRRAARPAPPPPVAAEGEIVVRGLGPGDLDRLVGEGFVVLSERVTTAGARLLRLRVPPGVDADGAIRRVGELDPAASADRNHFYRPQQDGACTAPVCRNWSEIGWQVAADRSCAGRITVGVVDTGVNAGHDVFAGRRLEVLTTRDGADAASELKHGTAVVALLLGAPESRVPGLIPDARVVAADPFTRAGRDERTDAFGLVSALDAVAEAGADVVNLSLAGPDNGVLAGRVAEMIADGTVVVAAVGNGGPRAKPLFPAGYDGVIGVTAVDGRGRVYRRALRGDQVDLAAPGVEVPTAASIRGVRPQTGTSFAAPFVTAAAALLVATRPGIAPDRVEAALGAAARDLGDPGRDPVFGYGLLQAAGECGEAAIEVETD